MPSSIAPIEVPPTAELGYVLVPAKVPPHGMIVRPVWVDLDQLDLYGRTVVTSVKQLNGDA